MDTNLCSLCNPSPQPSAAVLAAIAELESGGGIRFDTVEEMFAYLEDCSDEDEDTLLVSLLPVLIEQAVQETPTDDWRKALDEL